MTPSELDYYRAKLLADRPSLRAIICCRPLERVFAPRAFSMCALQERFFLLRSLYQTTTRVDIIEKLAGVRRAGPGDPYQSLERLDRTLSRAALGWRGTKGKVVPFAVDNPKLEDDPGDDPTHCAHGVPWSKPCEQCEAAEREVDAL